MNLTKNKWYRITDIDGKKCKMRFISKGDLLGTAIYFFKEWSESLYIGEDCIVKVESYKTISPDEQAREMGRLDEYKMYMMVNGKTLRNKYIYKTIFETKKQGA